MGLALPGGRKRGSINESFYISPKGVEQEEHDDGAGSTVWFLANGRKQVREPWVCNKNQGPSGGGGPKKTAFKGGAFKELLLRGGREKIDGRRGARVVRR